MLPRLPRALWRRVVPCCAAALLPALLFPAQAAPLQLAEAQVRALGLRSAPAQAAPTAARRYPAQVLLPASQQRLVAAPLAGLVVALPAPVGASVRAGQPVAQLQSLQLGELRREAQQAEAAATLAQQALARDEQLHREGLIATARLEATRAQQRQATALQQERRAALAQLGGARADGSGLLTLTAPISGVVLEQPAALGQRVEAASPLLRLGAPGTLWLELQVPAAEAGALRTGDAVAVADAAVEGRIIALGATVDAASQTVLVRAELRGVEGRLRPGQLVQALVRRAAGAAVTLPAAALLQDGAAARVFVERARGRYEAVSVKLLGRSGDEATVSGLAPGTAVVVQGTAALKALAASAE